MVLNGRSGSVWVASTCSTSDVPDAHRQRAECAVVEVWLSLVIPGCETQLRSDDVHDAPLDIY